MNEFLTTILTTYRGLPLIVWLFLIVGIVIVAAIVARRGLIINYEGDRRKFRVETNKSRTRHRPNSKNLKRRT